jgi:hypothetical protein
LGTLVNNMYYAQHGSTHMCVEVAGYSHADDRMKQRDYSFHDERIIMETSQSMVMKMVNTTSLCGWMSVKDGKTRAYKNSGVTSNHHTYHVGQPSNEAINLIR